MEHLMRFDNGIARGKFGEAGRLVTEDPAVYEVALRPWELMCSPIDRGTFGHSVTFLKTPSFVLYRETYDLAVVLQGLAPPDMLASVAMLQGRPQRAADQVYNALTTGAKRHFSKVEMSQLELSMLFSPPGRVPR